MKKYSFFIGQILFAILLAANTSFPQTADFTYQGRLTSGSLPAGGNYDFEFRLYDALTGGNLLGMCGRDIVSVANGVFTVRLDFPSVLFDGGDRFLEISVHLTGSPDPFTVLTPRQPITSAPYSIRSLNAAQLGGINANQYVLTGDSRLSDARIPLPNSTNYIQNTTLQQSSSSFNISGSGTVGGTLSANEINSTTAYRIGSLSILSNTGSNNIFLGVSAGLFNTTGQNNTFVGRNAGNQNTTGSRNSFFGSRSGESGTTGNDNVFFGFAAGLNNNNGNRNSFFGTEAGESNTTGDDNAFFGYLAGLSNTANGNSFFGSNAGSTNTTGINNAFFGRNAGNNSSTGNGNSFFGNGAGITNTTSSANSFFGNNAGSSNSIGSSNTFLGNAAGNTNTSGSNNTVIGANADVSTLNLSFAAAIGAGAVVGSSNTIVLGRDVDNVVVRGTFRVVSQITAGSVVLDGLGGAGSTSLCRNSLGQISTCSSSLRYKTDVRAFNGGLNILNRLRPISFRWKESRFLDVGFGAEDVLQVEPLLVTYNEKGEIEGVKYAQITTVLVNAVKEQQTQIEAQARQIEQQKNQIEALRKLICVQDPAAEICKEQ